MKIQTAKKEDFENWLTLAKEVEHVFGPMAEEISFHNALKRLIDSKEAFCIKLDNELCGGIAISKDNNEIIWFAISEKHRGNGYGKLLLQYALKQLDIKRDITVQTFAENISEGVAARHLYNSFGFADYTAGKKTPAGIPTMIMLKPKQ